MSNNENLRDGIIPVEDTRNKKGMTKGQIIKEVAELTELKQAVVRDVLNAFTDVCMREMIITGVLSWPNLPSVYRIETGPMKRYQPEIDKTILYPKTVQLRAKIPSTVRRMHRELFRNQNNELNGVTREDWWKPYYYCDGDWREKEK